MTKLSIIGCGKLGKSLGRLFSKNLDIEIFQIVNRTIKSSEEAASFIGHGHPIQSINELSESDIFLISTNDDSIQEIANQLASNNNIKKGCIVFHCSGSLPSNILNALQEQGILTASIHPIKSFADPEQAWQSFEGTYCGYEGEPTAIKVLKPIFEQCGGILLELNPEHKLVYHAGTVFICNYLTTLLELGLKCYDAAGISRQTAMQLMKPIINETLKNNYEFGTANALTGPIARGDLELFNKQAEALKKIEPVLNECYLALGKIASEIAKKKALFSN